MTNERFFRMLSVAVLGLLALAAVPNSRATDAQGASAQGPANDLPIEVTVVREVDEINAGRFNPMVMPVVMDGREDDAFVIPSPVLTKTVSQVDPNL